MRAEGRSGKKNKLWPHYGKKNLPSGYRVEFDGASHTEVMKHYYHMFGGFNLASAPLQRLILHLQPSVASEHLHVRRQSGGFPASH